MTRISIPTNILKAVAVAMGGKPLFVGGVDFRFLLVDPSGILIASDGRVTHVGKIKDIKERTTGSSLKTPILIPKAVVKEALRYSYLESVKLSLNGYAKDIWSFGGCIFKPIPVDDGFSGAIRITPTVSDGFDTPCALGLYPHFDLSKVIQGVNYLFSDEGGQLCFVEGKPHTFTAHGFEDCFMATVTYQMLPSVKGGLDLPDWFD